MKATWPKDDAAWLEAHPGDGLPPEPTPYVHAHQRWANIGPRDTGRPRPMAWDLPAFRATAACCQETRHERTVRWLRETYARA